jgi:ClpP class serine protease
LTCSTLLPDATRTAHKTVFVLEFSGDTQASGVKALSAEITALLQLNQLPDEVIIKIQSPGGTVTGYGLASAELKVICLPVLTPSFAATPAPSVGLF